MRIVERLARWIAPWDRRVAATTLDAAAAASRGRHFESDPDVTRWLEDLAAEVRRGGIRRFW